MPCGTVTTQAVVLTKAMPDVLKAGLEADGWEIRLMTTEKIMAIRGNSTVIWTKGVGLSLRGSNVTQAPTEIVQAYSKAAVSWAAQRAGWTVQAGANKNQVVVTRR